MMNMKTLQDVEQYAAEQGIVLTTNERDEIARIQQSERQRLAQSSSSETTLADRFNAFYPRLLAFLAHMGDTILTFTQAVIVSLGVPIVLVLLLAVEHQRVLHGIMLFETEYALANFAAFALVLLNLVLEFQVHYIEHQAGYEQDTSSRWSLRLWLRNMSYRIGLSKDWQPIAQSPAQRYHALLRLVTFSILALALVGSMRDVIARQSGTWHEALIHILLNSSLIDMMTWLGGLLFAMAAVLSAQGLSRYVALRCVEILATSPSASDAQYHAIEQAGAMAALAIVNAKLEKKRKKEDASKRPFGNTPHTTADRVNGQMSASANGNGYAHSVKDNGKM